MQKLSKKIPHGREDTRFVFVPAEGTSKMRHLRLSLLPPFLSISSLFATVFFRGKRAKNWMRREIVVAKRVFSLWEYFNFLVKFK